MAGGVVVGGALRSEEPLASVGEGGAELARRFMLRTTFARRCERFFVPQNDSR
jgi:hypothetical protein